MHFLRGFNDELQKLAAPSVGRIAKIMSIARRGEQAAHGARSMSLGKGLLLGGGGLAGGAAAGGAFGKKKGKKEGYEAGTEDTMEVAQQARSLGRREGVMAYHQALQARLRGESQ